MNRDKTIEAARGKWRGILATLGIDPKFLDGKHGPCPLCAAGKDRFRWDDKDGSGSYFCSACGAGTGMQLLMAIRGWAFPRAAWEIDNILGTVKAEAPRGERSDSDKAKAIRRTLEAAGHVQPGTAAWNYLNRRCGDPSGLLDDLRSHCGLRHSLEFGVHPAMLAIMRYPDGQGSSVHRTFLTPDGFKAAVDPVRKIMPGFPLEGSAVRLGPLQERLGIAEGIETAICAGKLFGLPVWAGISANGLLSWTPPEGVRSILICGDHDENYVGQAAAYGKAKQLRAKGFEVEIRIPAEIGADFCDVWEQSHQLEVK